MDPQSALETWDEGVAYLGEHDVRFFEGFMARDAALLHTSDGQLETALTLFETAIEAFLRAGAVAQLTITLASLPALFERLGRPAAACTLLGAMARLPPASTTSRRWPTSVSGCVTASVRSGRTAAPPAARPWTSRRPRRTPSTRSARPQPPSSPPVSGAARRA